MISLKWEKIIILVSTFHILEISLEAAKSFANPFPLQYRPHIAACITKHLMIYLPAGLEFGHHKSRAGHNLGAIGGKKALAGVQAVVALCL